MLSFRALSLRACGAVCGLAACLLVLASGGVLPPKVARASSDPDPVAADSTVGWHEAARSTNGPIPGGGSYTLTVKVAQQDRSIGIGGFPYPSEITPLLARALNGNRLFLMPTAWTHRCLEETLADPLWGPVTLPFSRCSLLTKPRMLLDVGPDGSSSAVPPAQVPAYAHNQSYDGALGYAIVGGPGGGKRMLFIRHNEHQYRSFGPYVYPSTVFPEVPALPYNPADCPARYDAQGVWHNCWESFAQFVSLAWAAYDPGTGSVGSVIDEGPILWPSKSYRDWNHRGWWRGFYQPTLFHDTANGYLHVFYVNGNDSLKSGHCYSDGTSARCHQCIAAARATESSLGLPGAWKNYFVDPATGVGDFTESALPVDANGQLDFDKNNLGAYLYPDKAGGRSSCLFNDAESLHKAATWFNVARVRGTPYYVGLESRVFGSDPLASYDRWEMGLRVSRDLIHWTPLDILEAVGDDWGAASFEYPTFYDRTASTNYEVDAGDFYVLGKSATGESQGYTLNSMNLRLDLAGYSPPLTKSREEVHADRYYTVVLGWPNMPLMDQGGIGWHVARFHAGESCAQVLTRFIEAGGWKRSRSSREYVSMLYRTVLLREPDGPALDWWTANLDAGNFNRDSIVAAIAQTREGQWVCRAGRAAVPDGSTVKIYAQGTPAAGAYPSMRLVIDGIPVQAWHGVGPGLTEYTYRHWGSRDGLSLGRNRVRVEFTNDRFAPPEDRNLRVDRINIDGASFETEASTTYSVSCGAGYLRTEWLHCNGYFQY